MKNKFLVFFLLAGILSVDSQSSINDYKYVVVPQYFDFIQGKNTYRLNSNTRFLLKKNGFDAYMAGELEQRDYLNNKCLALDVNVINLSNMLKTKLKLTLTNCKEEVIFETEVGESKSKEYKVAYNEALNKAFRSFEGVNYNYVPNEAILSEARTDSQIDVVQKETVEKLKAEIEELKAERKEVQTSDASKKVENEKFNVKEDFGPTKNKGTVEGNKKVDNEKFNVKEEFRPTKSNQRLATSNAKKSSKNENNLLRAKETDNGYQLTDKESKIVMVLIETPQKDFYIVKDQNAIVFKEDGVWFYSKGEEKKQLSIKF